MCEGVCLGWGGGAARVDVGGEGRGEGCTRERIMTKATPPPNFPPPPPAPLNKPSSWRSESTSQFTASALNKLSSSSSSFSSSSLLIPLWRYLLTMHTGGCIACVVKIVGEAGLCAIVGPDGYLSPPSHQKAGSSIGRDSPICIVLLQAFHERRLRGPSRSHPVLEHPLTERV